MLFLLSDFQGRGLVVAEADSRAEAERFGREHLPEFGGEIIEIDVADPAQVDSYGGVRTVRVVRLPAPSDGSSRITRKPKRATTAPAVTISATHIWVRGPQLPEEVEQDNLLTLEDHRDLTLDHIARTSALVAHVEIRKWA